MGGKFAGWLTYIPALPNWVFTSQNSIGGSSIMSDIARPCLSSGLVFDMYEMSIALNADNLISRSPFQVPFARLLVLEIYTISYLEGWFVSCHFLLSSFKSVFI